MVWVLLLNTKTRAFCFQRSVLGMAILLLMPWNSEARIRKKMQQTSIASLKSTVFRPSEEQLVNLFAVSQKKRSTGSALCQIHHLKEASNLVNLALQEYSQQPMLHVFNGLIYEYLAFNQGEPGRYELAGVAYQLAHHLDPSNWHALYFLGKYLASQKRFGEAQIAFSKATLLKPKHIQTLHHLAFCAYYTQDFNVAEAAIRRVLELEPTHLCCNQSAVLIFAAAAHFEEAEKSLQFLMAHYGINHPLVLHVKERLEDWKQAHARIESGSYERFTSSEVSDQSPEAIWEKALQENTEVILECYLLRIHENRGKNKGRNLLENWPDLNLTGLVTGNGLSDKMQEFFGLKSRVNYSLNILNAEDQVAEIFSQPRLRATLNASAKMHSGDLIKGGIQGALTSEGRIDEFPVGILLEICLNHIDKEWVELQISLEGSHLPVMADPSRSLSNQTLMMSRTAVSSTLKLQYNESGILGGIQERRESRGNSGLKSTKRLPLFRNLFNNRQNSRLFQEMIERQILTSHAPDTLNTCPLKFKFSMGYLRTGDVCMLQESEAPILQDVIRSVLRDSLI